MTTSLLSPLRFIGLDVHKHYVMVGGVDSRQQIVLSPRKLSLTEFARWQSQCLTTTDVVALEATGSAWHLYDQLTARGATVYVANPLLVDWIGAAPVKTDRHDTLKLARLLAAGLLPTVWVPPEPVRLLRALVAHRQRLIRQRTRLRNRLQGLLQRHNLAPSPGNLFGPALRIWWQQLELAPLERLLVDQDQVALEQLAPLIDQVDSALSRQSTSEPWASQMPYLLQQPGIGLVTAMTLLAAVGDIARFAHPRQLVGYAGLGVRIHASGQTHHTGSITKQGRRELRAAMVEAAWSAVTYNTYWKTKFARYAPRLGEAKAIVAIARHLLVSIWYLWHNHSVDRHSDALATAHKLWTWAEQGGRAMRHGLSCSHFVRLHLDQLAIGQELTELRVGSHIYRLPPPGAIAALPVAS